MVDHPCEKCGAEVEDGRPFCPKCRAPQVRVEIALPSFPLETVIPAPPIAAGHETHSEAPAAGDPVFFRTALQAGLLGVMANLIPFGLGMVLTGILAALLYHRERGPLAGSRAARLGAAAGAISFAATALLAVVLVVLFHLQQQVHDSMLSLMEQSLANQSDPQAQRVLDWIHTAQGFETMVAVGMIASLLVSMLLSAVGGVIGSYLFRNRNRAGL